MNKSTIFTIVIILILIIVINPGVDSAEKSLIKERAHSEITLDSNSEIKSLYIACMVPDVEWMPQETKNRVIITATATVLLKELLQKIPGIKVVEFTDDDMEYNINSEIISIPETETKLNMLDDSINTVAMGFIETYQADCLSGGFLILGVRKIQYNILFHLVLKNTATGKEIYNEYGSNSYIDKSIGFRRNNIELSIPAANKLVKPAIDSVILKLYSGMNDHSKRFLNDE